MTPRELRMAADTLTGEARGRLLERADVLEDLLARKGEPVSVESLAAHYAEANHVTKPKRPSVIIEMHPSVPSSNFQGWPPPFGPPPRERE